MPFTPFHFGPALLLKSALPRRFSFFAFVASQVIIDLETLYWLSRDAWPYHRVLHTFLGGTLVGAAVGAALGFLARPLVGRLRRFADQPILLAELSLAPALAGGLVGGVSHPFLDGIMHSDVQPLRPISAANPLLGLVGLRGLHLACAAAGLVGLVWLAGRLLRRTRSGC